LKFVAKFVFNCCLVITCFGYYCEVRYLICDPSLYCTGYCCVNDCPCVYMMSLIKRDIAMFMWKCR